MIDLIETKIQELEQIRQNLRHNANVSEGMAKAYQEMAIEIVESCQKALREVSKEVKFPENLAKTIEHET